MFERFTERARQIVVLAQEEARKAPSEEITTMHLLGGCLREEEGLAARALVVLGIKLEDVREQYHRVPDARHTEGGQVPFTDAAKQALELALREALSLGHNYIGTEHVLLGLSRTTVDPDSAQRWLTTQGADGEKVRDTVIRMLTTGGRSHERGAAPRVAKAKVNPGITQQAPNAEAVASLIESVASIVGATAALVQPVRVREQGESLAQKTLREIADMHVACSSQADAEALIAAIQQTASDTLEAMAA